MRPCARWSENASDAHTHRAGAQLKLRRTSREAAACTDHIVALFRQHNIAFALAIFIAAAPAHARITRIVIDETISPAFCKGAACAAYGSAGQYEQIAGRAFGELDPRDPLNALIQDIALGKDADGKVRYVTTFVITKPIDLAKASGMLWHDVPNRGRPVTFGADGAWFRRRRPCQRVAGRQRKHERRTRHRGAADDERRRRTTGCRFRSRGMPTAPQLPVRCLAASSTAQAPARSH